MQAPPYNRTNAFAQDERNNVGGRSTVRTDQVDAEFDNVSASINALGVNLALIQRDDGRLRDQTIELWNLTAAARLVLQIKLNPRGVWQPLTLYAPNDLVDAGGIAYIAATAHLSGASFATDYALGRWQIFVATANAAASAFAPTSTVLSTTVQGAITEVDSKLRAAITPHFSAFYGGL